MSTNTEPLRTTSLYGQHLKLGAKLFPFGAWHMPLNYGSDLLEHERVRHHAGLFDVSHMCIIDVTGKDAERLTRLLCCTDIARYSYKQCMYTCFLNEEGGVIDDLIVYKRGPDRIRYVVNANCANKDIAWITQQASSFSVEIITPNNLSLLALQGPEAVQCIRQLFSPEEAEHITRLPSFSLYENESIFVSRTGYTGEDGFECIVSHEQANALWEKALSIGVTPCGLGARNILRLEAGMNLYGHEMDDTIRPQESGNRWTIDLRDPERSFIGKAGAQQMPRFKRLGVITKERGMLRDHMSFQIHDQEALITSGSYSPILNRGIGLCRVPVDCQANEEAVAIVRNREIPLMLVMPPFIALKRK